MTQVDLGFKLSNSCTTARSKYGTPSSDKCRQAHMQHAVNRVVIHTFELQDTSAGPKSALPTLCGQVICCHTSGAQHPRISGT